MEIPKSAFRKDFKKAIPVLIFDLAAFIAMPLLEKASPTGPCNPGMGIMLFFPAFIISVFIFIRYLVSGFMMRKEGHVAVAMFHFFAWLIFIITICILG